MMLLDSQRPNTIHCWAWNRIYVKSNGRVPCWCDAGETHSIIKTDFERHDFVLDVLNSAVMREMRLKIIRDGKHYIKQCHNCCCLLTQGKPQYKRYNDSNLDTNVTDKSAKAMDIMKRVSNIRGWSLGSIDTISEMQVEPSFPCNLRCPGCLHGWHPDAMGSEDRPFFLPLPWFMKIIDSLVNHAVRLKRIAFVGRGEPTLNKEFPEIIAYARANIPSVFMSMDSNSTQLFKEEYLVLDKINCSIDGSTKQSYDTYRRGGNFESALKFMSQAASAKKRLNSSCKIQWKYILFNTTEDIKLLNKAQEIASDLAIDELNFVITACGAADGSVSPPLVMNTIVKVEDYIKTHKIFQNVTVSRS